MGSNFLNSIYFDRWGPYLFAATGACMDVLFIVAFFMISMRLCMHIRKLVSGERPLAEYLHLNAPAAMWLGFRIATLVMLFALGIGRLMERPALPPLILLIAVTIMNMIFLFDLFEITGNMIIDSAIPALAVMAVSFLAANGIRPAFGVMTSNALFWVFIALAAGLAVRMLSGMFG